MHLTQLTLYRKTVGLFMRLMRLKDEINNLLTASFEALWCHLGFFQDYCFSQFVSAARSISIHEAETLLVAIG